MSVKKVLHGENVMVTMPKPLILWGTYDTGKPRTRIITGGLRSIGVNFVECHKPVWSDVKDKSQLSGATKIFYFVKSICTYPLLIKRYFSMPDHDIVLFPYMGIFDILVFGIFVNRFAKKKLVYDIFVPLYDTVVNDRKLLSKNHLLARLFFILEKKAVDYSDLSFLDTRSHAEYFCSLYSVERRKVKHLFVGAEEHYFRKDYTVPQVFENSKFNVLFYGQFIPLHGIQIIIEAAEIIEKSGYSDVTFILAGKGQETEKIDKLIASKSLKNIVRTEWVVETELVNWIKSADICLGIFGDSKKAKSVIPNKVYQILAAGKIIITADTEAIRELLAFTDCAENVITVTKPYPQNLAEKVIYLYREKAVVGKCITGFRPVDIARKFMHEIEMLFEQPREQNNGIR